ncbi:hypothetical protein TYRP_021318 [Tyrophagus putrescentiae]|nr:hypothetical protein TYRP_021318 [Tyrophagus putrescentiae]
MAALRPSFSASRLSASRLSASRLSAPRLSPLALASSSHPGSSSPVKPPLDLDDAVGVGANWLLENVSESDHKHFYCEVKHAAKFEVCLRMKTLFLDKKWDHSCVLYLFDDCIRRVSQQVCPLQTHELKVLMFKFLVDELGADFNGNGSPNYAKCVPDYLFVQFVFAIVYFIISLLILIFWGTFSGFLNGTPPLPPNQQQPEAFKVIKVPSDLIELQSAFRRLYAAETPFPHNTGEPFPGEQKVPKTVEPAVPFPVGPASAPPYPVDPVVPSPSAPAPPYPVGPAVPGPSAPAPPYPVNVPPYPLHFPVYPPQPADNPFTGESADVVKVNTKKVKKGETGEEGEKGEKGKEGEEGESAYFR